MMVSSLIDALMKNEKKRSQTAVVEGDARRDWFIIYALSEVIGRKIISNQDFVVV